MNTQHTTLSAHGPRVMQTLRHVMLLIAALVAAPSAFAASGSWTGTANALWNDAGNWTASPAPTTNEAATFNSAGNGNTTIDLTGGITSGTNIFDTISAAAYNIGAGGAGAQTLTMSAPGAITVNSTVTSNQLFNANLSLGTAAGAKAFSIANNSATAGLTLAGAISTTQTGTNTITFSGAGTTTINGQISNGSGAVSLVKGFTGGTVILASSNNFLGVSFNGGVNAGDNGAIRLTHSNALTGATITMNGGNDTTQTIELANNITVTNRINSISRTAGRPMIRNVSGTNTYAGNYNATGTGGGVTFESAAGKLFMTGSFTTNAGVTGRGLTLQGAGDAEITYSMNNAVNGITKNGSGTWTFSAANTFAGGITHNAGTLNMAHPNALSTATITFAGTSNATLNIATDGADTASAVAAGSSTIWTIASDVKTGSVGINHTLGAFAIGSGAPALQMNITKGPNVASGSPRITIGTLLLSAGVGGTTIVNPTTADITIPTAISTNTSKTLQLDGTSTGNQITGVISNISPTILTLVKSGTSTWTLSGVNTYGGNTTVSNGVLALSGSGSIASTNITVMSGGTLDVSAASFTLGGFQTLSGNGTVAGSVTASSGSQITPGGNSTVGKITVTGTLTLAGGSTAKFDFDPGTNDTVAVANLTPSGTTTINLATLPPGGLANGTYTLFTVTGTLGGSAANFAVSGAPAGRQTFTVVYDTASTPKRVRLQVSGSPASLVWRGVASAWDIKTSLNWFNSGGASNDVYFDGDNVNFTDTGTATQPVLDTNVQPSTVIFNSSDNYTLTGTGKITGGGSLSKTGGGTATIQTTNDYVGASGLDGGTVSVDYVANGGVASPLGAAPSTPDNLIFNGGALQVTGATGSTDRGATLNAGGGAFDVANAASTTTVSGQLTGAGALTKQGDGALTLSGANNYTGATIVSAGTLNTTANAIPNISAVTLADVTGATLNLAAAETIGSLAGGGVNGGNVTLGANTLTLGTNNSSTAYAGIMSGTGGFTKTGSGAFTLAGANTFTGSILVKSGTVVLDTGGSAISLTAFSSVGSVGTDVGTMTLKGSGALATTGDFNVGDSDSSVGTLNVQDSASLSAAAIYVGSGFNAVGVTASGTVNQTGGTVTQTSAAANTFAIGGRFSTNSVGVYNLSGGTLNAQSIRVGGTGTGTLNLSGSGILNAVGGLNIARIAGSSGTANLNGGTLTTLNIVSSTGVKSTNHFNGATVQPTGNNASFMSPAPAVVDIRNGGAVIDTAGFDITIAPALLHSVVSGDNATDGGLTKQNTGTLTLPATNTYTGPTVVSGGTLLVTGTLGTGAVTVNSGATLKGNGLLKGATTIQGGGTIVPGLVAGDTPGVITISNSLNFDASSSALFDFSPGSNSTLTVSGALNVNGATTINVDINTVLLPGTNTLIRYGSITGFGNLSVGTTHPRHTFSLFNDTVAKAVKLVVVGLPASLVWRGDGVNNFWDNAGSYSNWLNGATPNFFFDGDSATFNNTGSNSPAVNLLNDVFAASVTASATKDYELAGTGSITSPGGLTKSSSGKLTLSVSNTYDGPAVISGGTVQVGNAGTAGALTALAVTNNGALVFNRTDAIGFGTPITGTGSVTQDGTSDLVLSVSNSYAGTTLVNAGFLKPRNTDALGTAAGATVATNGIGQVYIDQNVNFANEPFILGGAALHKGGGGISALGGVITLVANAQFNVDGGATLNLTNASGITGPGWSLEFAGSGNGSVAGPLTLGSGGLTKNGSGTWTLGTNNSYTGLTTIANGTLRILDATVGNPGVFTANQVTLAGGTLMAATNVSFVGGNVGFAVTGTAGGLGAEAGATLTIANDISGTATLTKSGAGTLALIAANTFSGTLNLDTASIVASDGSVRVTTSNAIAAVTSPIYSRNNNGGSSTLQLDGSGGSIGIAQSFIASCRNSGVAWIQNLAGNNKLHGVVQSQVGGGTLIFQSDTGQLEIANNIQYVGGSTNGRTYQFSGAGNHLVSGVILNGDNTAIISVSKTGTGTLILAAANTYVGPTTVSGGLLSVTGSITSTGTVSVVGGTLGGTGTITDDVSIGAGGTLAPGASIGTLTINGNLTLAGSLAVEVNRSVSPSNDLCTVSGALVNTGGGWLTVANLGPALSVGNKFTLFNQPLVNGGALTITPAPGAGLSWSNRLAIDGSILVVPLGPTSYSERLYAVAEGTPNKLISFQNNAPGNILSEVALGVEIFGIDFVGETLYGVGSGSLYTIDRVTGAATLVGTFSPVLNGAGFGVEAEPAGVRVVSDLDQQLVLNYGSGAAAVGTDLIGGAATTASGMAYHPGTGVRYVVDTGNDTLGTLDPVTGLVTTIGFTGNDFSKRNGFDISGKAAYAGYVVSAAGSSGPSANLYTINLGTGVSQLQGLIGDGDPSYIIRGIAVGPEFSTTSAVNSTRTNITSIVVGGTNLVLSWPSSHLGWTLQMQTNSRAIGLKTNWVDVAGSSGVTATNFPILKTDPTVFYRLRLAVP